MSRKDYLCKTCNKYTPVDCSHIKLGDEVSFTTKYSTSNSARFSAKSGTVVKLTNDTCEVLANKKIYIKNIKDVSPENAPNPLTYALFGTCECKQLDTTKEV